MKKIELVYREILFNALEKNSKNMTQANLARTLKMSLSTVNLAIKPLARMNAVQIKTRSFEVIDAKKILYCWASMRNIEKDILYKTRVEQPVKNIEAELPGNTIFGAYSGYKLKFNDVPADYSEVYVYAESIEEIKKRFPANSKNPNLFVIQKDKEMDRYGKSCTAAQLFVDLWNLKEWYAKEFLIAVEEKINGLLE